MKRVFLTLALAAIATFSASLRAEAVTELCPAAVSDLNALDAAKGAPGAQLFSYELQSLSPETVSGTLSISTSDGWYQAHFAATTLAEHLELYTFGQTTFTRKNFFSAPQYIRFPSAVSVKSAFISTISTDDTTFSWPTKKEMTCENAGAPIQFAQTSVSRGANALGSPVHPALLAMPAPTAAVGHAKKTAIFDGLGCSEPFVSAAMTSGVQPNFPDAAKDSVAKVMIMVAVALDERGKVVDDWLWAPSSLAVLNDAAMHAAELSTYRSATSRCSAVPSIVMYRADFQRE